MTWSDADARERFLIQLAERGYDRERLADLRRLVDAPDSDLYDVLAHVLFTTPALTRHDRAERVRQTGLNGFDDDLREVLLSLLNAYETSGEAELTTQKLSQLLVARYGSVSESKSRLGELSQVRNGFQRMQAALYAS